ncbi:MAG: EF-P lysine aminoacylase EpmA [Thiohalophilus sp.]|jgi:lysyl-tRNA synthetase class 2
MADEHDWRPGADSTVMQRRARMLQQLRAFFEQRGVIEVETPILNRHTVTDVHIDSLAVEYHGWLQTSPEYPMKRLLASGSGDIYQICRVFRAGEAGHQHNPEFSMLEWYRLGFDQHDLMREVDELVRAVLDDLSLGPTVKLSYRQLFHDYLDMDPLHSSIEEMQQVAAQHNINLVADEELERDDWLDLLLSHSIQPRLPNDRPVLVHDFPASQGALARLHEVDGETVACRFELYLQGMELANGYHELLDAVEQRQRFELDRQRRIAQGRPAPAIDEKFLAALEYGLPDCAGVALGLDRLLMIATGLDDIRQVLSFSADRL